MPCVNWSEKIVKGIREIGFGEMVHETCSIEKSGLVWSGLCSFNTENIYSLLVLRFLGQLAPKSSRFASKPAASFFVTQSQFSSESCSNVSSFKVDKI